MSLQLSLRLSAVVQALRFPLILLVIFIHVPLSQDELLVIPWGLPLDGHTWYRYIVQLISFGLGDAAVPMFFLFSGYYMFIKPKAWWTKSVYWGEMKKRGKTLLLSYLIWCTLSLVADQGLAMAKGEMLPWGSWSSSWSYLVYTYVSGPANIPLWYVRDLILLAFLAPMVDWVSRRAPWMLLLLFLAYLAGWCTWAIPAPRGVIYFVLGAVLGSRQIDMLACADKGRCWILPLFAISSLVLPFLPKVGWGETINLLYVPLAMSAFLCLGGWVYDHYPRLHRWCITLERYVFFVYVSHTVLILALVKGFLYKRQWLETPWGYFVCAGAVLGITLLAYELLYRLARRPLALSLGGRV